MEADINQAIVKCQAGELEQFVVLYDQFVKKIYNFLYYRVRHKETAEDLTSLTFTKALDKISTFNPGQASFGTWLYRIARNSLFDHYRTQKPEVALDEALEQPGKQNVAREVGFKLDLEKMQKLMEDLTEEQREIIILRVWDGLSFKEIAEILGKSEAAGKMQFSRALKLLQSRMPLAMLLVLLLKFNN